MVNCKKSRKCKWASNVKYPGQCVPLEQIKHFPCAKKYYMTTPARLAVHKGRKKLKNCTRGQRRCKYVDDCVPKNFRCTKKNAQNWQLGLSYNKK